MRVFLETERLVLRAFTTNDVEYALTRDERLLQKRLNEEH